MEAPTKSPFETFSRKMVTSIMQKCVTDNAPMLNIEPSIITPEEADSSYVPVLRSIPSPKLFLQMTNLEKLYIVNVQLAELPKELCECPNLKEMWLQENKLTRLPEEIGKLQKLTELWLYDNEIAQLPDEIGSLHLLEELRLADNHLRRLPPTIDKLVSLKKLEVNNNKLRVLTPSIVWLSNLEVLALDHNSIPELPKSGWANLKRLKKLFLHDNRIEDLPLELGEIPQLEELHLQNNRLRHIPLEFCKLVSLSTLYLHDNWILNVPDKLLGSAKKPAAAPAIFKFLNDLQEGEEPCNKVKLMIAGFKSSGKSSLVQGLKGKGKFKTSSKRKDANLTTEGIDIQMLSSSIKKTKISWSVWDFAGEEMFSSTNRIFIAPRTIFALVWDMSAESPETQIINLEGWIQNIKLLAEDAVIYLVGTHLDKVSASTVAQLRGKIVELYAEKYDGLFAYEVDNKKGKGLEELGKSLTDIANKLPGTGEIIPKSFQLLEDAVIKERKKTTNSIISWTQFSEIAQKCSVRGLLRAARFLHEIGVILYFPEKISGLDKMVFLDPKVIVDLMSSIYSAKLTAMQNGILDHKHFATLWKKYSVDTYPNFLSLLEKFEICTRLYGVDEEKDFMNGRSLFPSFMADGPIQVDAQLTANLTKKNDDASYVESAFERVYEFPFTPTGLFSRLIVRCSALVRCNQYWDIHFNKSSILITKHSDEGLSSRSLHLRLMREKTKEWGIIELAPNKPKVSVFVVQPTKVNQQDTSLSSARLLQTLVDAIESLIEEWFAETKFSIKVSCSHCLNSFNTKEKKFQAILNSSKATTEEPQRFLMSQIEKTLQKGESQITCPKNKDPLKLVEMVPDISMSDTKVYDWKELAVEKELGKGSFATVYKGTLQIESQAVMVAIKKIEVLESKLIGFERNYFEEFRKEVSLMSELHHDNVMKLQGICLSPLCMITEFLTQGDLHSFLLGYADRELPETLRIKLALDMSEGLKYLHNLSPPLAHNDLKSPNILMSIDDKGEYVAKLGDLGLSRRLPMKVVGRKVDNPRWLAPEIMDNQPYNELADIFSLGIVFWELLERQTPYDDFDFRFPSQLEQQIVKGARPAIRASFQNTPYADLITECLHGTPAKRPTTNTIVRRLKRMQKGDDKKQEE